MQNNANGSESSLRNDCEGRMNKTGSQGCPFIGESRYNGTVESKSESSSTARIILINEGMGRRGIKGVV